MATDIELINQAVQTSGIDKPYLSYNLYDNSIDLHLFGGETINVLLNIEAPPPEIDPPKKIKTK